jgi:dimethylamine monooxygenase subunit B
MGGSFAVKLAKSGKTLDVPSEQTPLEVLLDVGVDAPFSCKMGGCDRCEVNMLFMEVFFINVKKPQVYK